MGEKIKNIGKYINRNHKFNIELNHSSDRKKNLEIHIQSSNARFELNESEFFQFASTIALAAENLKKIKK